MRNREQKKQTKNRKTRTILLLYQCAFRPIFTYNVYNIYIRIYYIHYIYIYKTCIILLLRMLRYINRYINSVYVSTLKISVGCPCICIVLLGRL